MATLTVTMQFAWGTLLIVESDFGQPVSLDLGPAARIWARNLTDTPGTQLMFKCPTANDTVKCNTWTDEVRPFFSFIILIF
jgi:hypothetical protein